MSNAKRNPNRQERLIRFLPVAGTAEWFGDNKLGDADKANGKSIAESLDRSNVIQTRNSERRTPTRRDYKMIISKEKRRKTLPLQR